MDFFRIDYIPMSQDIEENDLKAHVAICTLRYESIHERLNRIERVMIWVASILFTGLCVIAWGVAVR